MRSFFHKLLFGKTPVREYMTIGLLNEAIKEKVFFENRKMRRDVSELHWILSLEPLVFGIWMTDFDNTDRGSDRLTFIGASGEHVAVITLAFLDRITENNGALCLFQQTNTTIAHINPLKTRLIFERFYRRTGFSFSKLKGLATAFSYPRKVRLISFREGDYLNIFPMDLVGDLSAYARFVFGLRHSNTTLERILKTQQLAVSEVPMKYKEAIYQLGSHHSNAITENELPFKTIPSRNFGFPIPEWATSYKEIKILDSFNLGSHMLMWGQVMDEQSLSAETDHLYHIHFLYYLHQVRQGCQYQHC